MAADDLRCAALRLIMAVISTDRALLFFVTTDAHTMSRIVFALLSLHVASASAILINPMASPLLRAPAVHRLRGGDPTAVSISKDAIAIVVDVEIKPESVGEFLKVQQRTKRCGPYRSLHFSCTRAPSQVMEEDCKGSRNEPGCLRFDVLRASETRFFFYEAYTSAAAVDEHKAQPHFKLWSDFKAGGGVVSSVSTKASVVGDWGFQGKAAGRNVAF